ncbi:MAG: hypothetical protein QXG00_04845 [Candidatus Woesearchaeota archaeon]
MQQVIIEHNLDNLLQKLDYKIANKIDKKIIGAVTNKVKNDIKQDVRRLYKQSDKIRKYIVGKVRNNIGIISAKYIALFQNEGIKPRTPRKNKYLYFITDNGKFIKKKSFGGFTGKKFMEKGEQYINSGKYNDFIDKKIQKILDKELGDNSGL